MTQHFAIIGAGIAGITCARTLAQAGHQVTVFEKSRGPGGRMSTRTTPFGGFRQSGLGRDRSGHALDNYTELKTTWLHMPAAPH